MAYSPSEKYPGAVDSDPNYQGGKFRDNNPSTTNNGSPLKAIDRNELLARDEAIMNDAGFEYNGLPDTPQDSQMFRAYKASLGNGANLLSNHNFLIQTPDDSQPPPDATPRSYPPGYQIFSGVFANETTGITNLTYIDGRVSFSGGDFYMPVPSSGAIARLSASDLVASVADFDGKPRTRGVSFALVGDEYRVTVGIDALEDESANETLLGSVKFEQGSVATGHEVGFFVGNKTIEDYGVSKTATPQENAKYLLRSIAETGCALTSFGPYEFDFTGIDILPVSHKTVNVSLGSERHTFKNYQGIHATEASHAKINMVIDCDDTWFSHFFRFEKIEAVDAPVIDIKNVQLDLVNNEAWFARVNQGNDVEATFNIGLVRTVNWKGYDDKPTTLSVMSLFGQFHSGSPKVNPHTYNIGVCYIDEWYTIDSNTGDISDGESDWFRTFQCPHFINIGVCVANNFAKRFVKSQNETHISVGTMLTKLDGRFEGSVNHIATFDLQILNGSGNAPSSLTVDNLHIDYDETIGNPLFLAATSSGAHSLTINNGTYKKFSVSGSGPVSLSVDNFKGSETFINTPNSEMVKFSNYIDTRPVDYRCPNLTMENCKIYGSEVNANSIFDIAPASLTNVTFDEWDIGRKIGLIQHMDNVTFNFTQGTIDNRPIAPSEGENFYSNITVNNTSGTNCILLFRSSAVDGVVNISNAKLGADMSLAFMTSGNWDFVLNNCDNEVITGSAVNSKVKATYTAF